MLGRVVMQRAFGTGVKARIAVLVAAQTLRPQPEPVGNPLFVGIADQALPEVFCLAYVNTINVNGIHRALWPCKPCECG
ncbi:hypothetical protein D3C80_1846110 [compost metagenome]